MVTWLPHMVFWRFWDPPPRGGSASLPQNSHFCSWIRRLGRGEHGLGRHLEPTPPHKGILLFASFSINYMTSGLFSWCQLSLLMQHIFLILTSHPGMATGCCSALKAASGSHLLNKGEALSLLKGVWHEILDFRFLSWISFPRPLSIAWGPFRIFTKICGEIWK